MSSKFDEMSDDILDFRDLEDQLSQICDRSDIEECLKQQLLEIEMIQSMFSNPGEFVMDDPSQMIDVNEYVAGKTSKIPPRFDFSINLTFDKMKVEACVNLPQDYPVTEPDVFVRSNVLNRHQQHLLNEDVTNYITLLGRGETCLCSVISWLQENSENYSAKEGPLVEEIKIEREKSFSRFWIYSHHIYSKNKRKEILSLAADFNLTGFMLPGKPGIICVEAESQDCEEWWSRIRAMNWKKIVVRKKELYPFQSKPVLNKFLVFEEISFKNVNNRGIEHHMDMGELYKYLDKHNCAYIFMDYFGVSGKPN